MTEAAIHERFNRMEQLIFKLVGTRLTREEMADRLRISTKTLLAYTREGKVPTPAADGKWLLSEVLEWEAKK